MPLLWSPWGELARWFRDDEFEYGLDATLSIENQLRSRPAQKHFVHALAGFVQSDEASGRTCLPVIPII